MSGASQQEYTKGDGGIRTQHVRTCDRLSHFLGCYASTNIPPHRHGYVDCADRNIHGKYRSFEQTSYWWYNIVCVSVSNIYKVVILFIVDSTVCISGK